MSQNTKIVLIVVGVLVVLCCCAVVATAVLGLTVFNTTSQVGEFVEMAPDIADVVPGPAIEQTLPEVAEGDEQVKEVAGRIADFDLPESYYPEYGMHMFGFDMVGFNSRQGRGFIMMMQFPADMELDLETMQEQMQQFMQTENTGWSPDLEVIETKTMQVRGQEQPVTISEGTNGDGDTYRQMVVGFEGKSGPALLVMVAQMDEWDQALFEGFVSSLR